MSSDSSSVNAQTVEQTKQQIRGLVSEIATLAKSELSPEEFYSAFLQRVVSALAAVGGAVWLTGEGRQLELAYQINLSETLLDDASDETQRHMRLLNQVVQSTEPQLIPPLAGPGDADSAGNPTHFLLVLAPLATDKQIEGVVEVFQRPNAQPATQRGYLRFVMQMCELAAEWIRGRKLKHFSDRHSLWAQADEFARLAHESLDVRETSYAIVNEARRMVGCDRVSVALKRGQGCHVEAISGQDTMENRSNIIAAINRLATRVVATGEPLWYEGATDDLPPQIEQALDDYVDESYAKSVTVLPLRKPDRVEDHTDPQQSDRELRRGDREIYGALIVEQIETDLPREVIEPRIDLVYEHSARALSNALSYNGIFLMPLWRAIGSLSFLVKARNLPKTVITTAVILFLLVGAFVFRTDFDMEARGSLQPVEKRDVFFGMEGIVDRIDVKDGQLVEKDQVLLQLINLPLEQRRRALQGEYDESVARQSALREQATTQRLTRSDEAQIALQMGQLATRVKNLRLQLELIDEERGKLTVRSPIDGQVMLPWDAEHTLLHRPVSATQKALTVADPTGAWELELAMPERHIGHIDHARESIKEDLDVSYILATDPRNSHSGTIRDVHTLAQVSGEDGPTIKILVDIDKSKLVDPRPGATVTADVNCGKQPIIYAWGHEALEWVQRNILF